MNALNKVKNVASNFFSFPLVDSNITVHLIVEGKEYEVEQFRVGFSQSTDNKGEPQSEITGGQFMISLSQAVPESIYSWIIKPAQRKDGEIVFKNHTSSSPLKIEFFNAACVTFNREVKSSGGIQTNLVLSPERLLLNGVEHDNYWIE